SAGCATPIRSRGRLSVAAVSSAVNAEFAKITPHEAAAFRYLWACIERVRPVTHSGKCSGTRSWIVVARRPPRWGGYIQSVKWSTANGPRNRSAGGRPPPGHAGGPAGGAGERGTVRCAAGARG